MNIAFMASYNGSSAKAITDACLEGEIVAAPTLMICNNSDANALVWAEERGLKTFIANKATHADMAARDQAIAQKLRDNKIQLLILSGYMTLVGPETLNAVKGRALNIHPALLPKHGGKGMFGRHVHEAVKAAGDEQTGVTIHLVNEEYDDGHIVAQKVIPLSPDDSVDDIESKVRAVEPELYIDTVRKILKGDITLDN